MINFNHLTAYSFVAAQLNRKIFIVVGVYCALPSGIKFHSNFLLRYFWSNLDTMELKTLKRNYQIFVAIGICEPPSDIRFVKKTLHICVYTIVCALLLATIVSCTFFVLEFISIDFERASNAMYPVAATFGMLCTMIISFRYRKELSKTFMELSAMHDRSK